MRPPKPVQIIRPSFTRQRNRRFAPSDSEEPESFDSEPHEALFSEAAKYERRDRDWRIFQAVSGCFNRINAIPSRLAAGSKMYSLMVVCGGK